MSTQRDAAAALKVLPIARCQMCSISLARSTRACGDADCRASATTGRYVYDGTAIAIYDGTAIAT
jgi:hypothetical protein